MPRSEHSHRRENDEYDQDGQEHGLHNRQPKPRRKERLRQKE
jgi:hypothetical protein